MGPRVQICRANFASVHVAYTQCGPSSGSMHLIVSNRTIPFPFPVPVPPVMALRIFANVHERNLFSGC